MSNRKPRQPLAPQIAISRRTRPSPFHERVVAAGAKAFTVYNHMLLPTTFAGLEDDYWHLRENVQVWDVSAERQVALRGPDARELAQWMSPRDLSSLDIGRCMYAPITNARGKMINDPIITRVDDDVIWLSIADSDVRLWAEGLALAKGMDVEIDEPDVGPLAIQGPKADDLMAAVFGDVVRDIKKFRWKALNFRGDDLIVARSGWSHQGGFEIYLDRPEIAELLWDAVMEAGRAYNVRAGCPNLIERIESGLMSYGNDMTIEDTPLECGLDRYCHLDRGFDFIGKQALIDDRDRGVARRLRGIRFGDTHAPACIRTWPVRESADDRADVVGQVTSAAWSPRFEENVAIAMMGASHCASGSEVTVQRPDGVLATGRVVDFPMEDAPLAQ
ncbi:MAG: dimethylsulfoniopropionate demethylase [Pseudomonadota bacterium]